MTTLNTEVKTEPRMYQNAYRATLNDADPDETEATSTQDPKATPTESTENLTPEEKTFKQRYDALKAHYDKTVVEDRKQIEALQTRLVKSNEVVLPKSPEELQAWRKEFPDVYDIFRTLIRMDLSQERKEIDVKLQELSTMSHQTRREKADVILRRYHPDFDELRADQKFHDWVKDQPKPIQDWLYENDDDPLLAAKAINMYKAEMGIVAKKTPTVDPREASKTSLRTGQSASDSTEGGKKTWKASDVRKLTPRQYEKLEEEIDTAIREGRFSMDE